MLVTTNYAVVVLIDDTIGINNHLMKLFYKYILIIGKLMSYGIITVTDVRLILLHRL